MKITYTQAEVIMDLVSDGRHNGFCVHDVFQNRDNLDNARRRTLRKLIGTSAFNKTNTTDIEGNAIYTIPPETQRAASAVLNKQGKD